MNLDEIILSQSEYESLLNEAHRLQTRISELTALRDDLIYHGIDILWEISVLSKKEARELLGSCFITELEELLEAAGSRFKPKDCLDELYGYPETIQKIAKEKEDYWRCFLFFSLYEYRYLQLRKVRESDTVFWSHEKAAFPVRKTNIFASIMSAELDGIRLWLRDFNTSIQNLNKASESEGDQDCIVNTIAATDKIIRQYKELMAFKRRFQYVDADESFRSLIEDIAGIGEQLCKGCIDKLYQKSMKAAKTLIDYMEDGKKGKEPELDLSLDFDVDMNKINQKIDALILDEHHA